MKFSYIIMSMTLLAAAGCANQQSQSEPVIGKNDIHIEGGRMTPEALWAMGRIGSANVNIEGNIVYQVSYYSVEQNKSNTELFFVNMDGTCNRQLTHSAFRESDPAWLPDGRIAYLSNESGLSQIWTMNADGTHRKQFSHTDSDIEAFLFTPDAKRVVFVSQVKTVPTTQDKYPDLDKASGRNGIHA